MSDRIKSYICANFQLLGFICRGISNYWAFWPPLTPRVLQNGSKYMVWKIIKFLNEIPQATLCIYVKRPLLVIILLQMANFYRPLPLSFWPLGARNDMGNQSLYQEILKNNPYIYQKTAEGNGFMYGWMKCTKFSSSNA